MLEKASFPVFVQDAQNPASRMKLRRGDGSSGRRSDVRSDRVVAGQAPVAFGDAEHLDYVPVRVVVAEERRVPVLGRPARLEIACGGRYGVPGIHYVGHPVAVAVDPRSPRSMAGTASGP